MRAVYMHVFIQMTGDVSKRFVELAVTLRWKLVFFWCHFGVLFHR